MNGDEVINTEGSGGCLLTLPCLGHCDEHENGSERELHFEGMVRSEFGTECITGGCRSRGHEKAG